MKSGRTEQASSDEGELKAITRATRLRAPLYFIRSGCGTTLDVLLDKKKALATCDVMRQRIHNGRPDINVYERTGHNLIRI